MAPIVESAFRNFTKSLFIKDLFVDLARDLIDREPARIHLARKMGLLYHLIL